MSRHRGKSRTRDVYLFNGSRCVGQYRSVKAAAQAAREKNLVPSGVNIVIPSVYRTRPELTALVAGQPVTAIGRVA